MKKTIVACLALFAMAPAFAQSIMEKYERFLVEPRTYVAYRTEGALNIDGKLDESSWQKAKDTEEFEDISGKGFAAPKYKTTAKMLWDDDYLYVGAVLEEPNILAKLTKRDTIIYYDNDFEVFIDPDNDGHNYFEIEVNANNVLFDLMLDKPYRVGGDFFLQWDCPGIKPQRAASRLRGGGHPRRARRDGRRGAARLHARAGPAEPAQGHRPADEREERRRLRLAPGLRHDGRLVGPRGLLPRRAAAGRQGRRLRAVFHGIPRLRRSRGRRTRHRAAAPRHAAGPRRALLGARREGEARDHQLAEQSFRRGADGAEPPKRERGPRRGRAAAAGRPATLLHCRDRGFLLAAEPRPARTAVQTSHRPRIHGGVFL